MELTALLSFALIPGLIFAALALVRFNDSRTWTAGYLPVVILLLAGFCGAVPLAFLEKTPFVYYNDLILILFMIGLSHQRLRHPARFFDSFREIVKPVLPLVLAMALYFFFSLASLYNSPDVLRSLAVLVTLGKSFLVFMFCLSFLRNRERDILTLLKVLPWFGLYLAAVIYISAHFQMGIGLADLLDWNKGYHIKSSIRTYLGNSNYLAGLLALILPLAIGAGVMEKGFKKALIWICATGIILGLIMTGSHGALLAILLSYGLIGFWFLTKKRAATLCFGILSILAVLYGINDRLILESYNHASHSLQNRLALLQIGSNLFLDNFWLGIGRGISRNEFLATHVHNSLLAAFIESGILGGTAFLALFTILFITLRHKRLIQTNRDLKIISTSILFSFGIALIHSQGEPLLENNLYDLFFWTLMGVQCALPEPVQPRVAG